MVHYVSSREELMECCPPWGEPLNSIQNLRCGDIVWLGPLEDGTMYDIYVVVIGTRSNRYLCYVSDGEESCSLSDAIIDTLSWPETDEGAINIVTIRDVWQPSYHPHIKKIMRITVPPKVIEDAQKHFPDIEILMPETKK